jgi:hypothetical protein
MVAATTKPQTTLQVERTMTIEAPIQISYEALLDQLGPDCTFQDGKPMSMKFEAWPGGRWFRDLGDDAGHWWGTVQVIKPPNLIEIHGPLWMSYPAISHVQDRLVAEGDATPLHFVDRGCGEGVPLGGGGV